MKLVFRREPFVGRVLAITLGALLMGFVALIFALTQGRSQRAALPAPSATVEWPDGFVEWQEVSASPLGGASAARPAPRVEGSASRE